jgi:hypothetical protein
MQWRVLKGASGPSAWIVAVTGVLSGLRRAAGEPGRAEAGSLSMIWVAEDHISYLIYPDHENKPGNQDQTGVPVAVRMLNGAQIMNAPV